MSNQGGNTAPPGKGMGTASMVLGIVALAFMWAATAVFPTIIAIIGIVLGVLGKKKLVEAGAPTGPATAGIVMSIIALAITGLAWILCLTACAALAVF